MPKLVFAATVSFRSLRTPSAGHRHWLPSPSGPIRSRFGTWLELNGKKVLFAVVWFHFVAWLGWRGAILIGRLAISNEWWTLPTKRWTQIFTRYRLIGLNWVMGGRANNWAEGSFLFSPTDEASPVLIARPRPWRSSRRAPFFSFSFLSLSISCVCVCVCVSLSFLPWANSGAALTSALPVVFKLRFFYSTAQYVEWNKK